VSKFCDYSQHFKPAIKHMGAMDVCPECEVKRISYRHKVRRELMSENERRRVK
jgi:hypothetical protein